MAYTLNDDDDDEVMGNKCITYIMLVIYASVI
jgi:hypothetical protein